MLSTTSSSIYQLLRDCTVRIEINGKSAGTGFFAAPGKILTCAHVVSPVKKLASSKLEVSWDQQNFAAQLDKITDEGYPDLALLTINLTDHPCVYFQNEETLPFDLLYTYGYPDNTPTGDPATPECEGTTNDQTPLLRLKNAQIRPGMSGAPVLNQRTLRVGSLIQYTRGRDNDMGGRALPISIVTREFPELLDLQQSYHQKQDIWIKRDRAINLFYAYAEEDEDLQKRLRTHLALLRRQRLIADWGEEEVLAGQQTKKTIDYHLNNAEVILLLVSSSFIVSPYCESAAMDRIMQRADEENAAVIPVLLRKCDLEDAPFGKLQPLPRRGLPVNSWPDKDEAFTEIARELRSVIKTLTRGTAKEKV
jgi:hypothetical protein